MQNPLSPYSIIGSQIIDLSETDSTNVYASLLLRNENKPEEGTCIFTRFQTRGRGQQNSGWESENGANLLFSFILYPEFLRADEQFFLNECISLALFDLLKFYGCDDAFIKWPNDIYVKHKKISGILIENSIQGANIKTTIVGIGLNINQQLFGEKLPNATSLSLIRKRHFDLNEVRSSLLEFLNIRYLQLKNKDFKTLHEDYSKVLYRINKPYLFSIADEIEEGIIKGVNDYGQLQVEINSELRLFNFKEIKYLFEIWN